MFFGRSPARCSCATSTVVRRCFIAAIPSSHFYYVGSGAVSLSLISASGERKIIEVVRAGRTFAEAVAFMTDVRYPATAEALEASTLCAIPNNAYRELLVHDPEACLRLLADICRHLHSRVLEIENLTIRGARGRLAAYLIDHATDIDGDTATVKLDLPRHVLASRLSIKPETLSRLLRSLADEGAISIDDRTLKIAALSALRPYD